MRNECDADDWVPDAKEVTHLLLFGLQQHVVVAIGSADNIEPWRIGKAAGFSPGKTTDEATCRANWTSAVSKATRKNRQTLPHIAALKDKLAQFRSDGGEPQSVSWNEMKQQCDFVIRNGEPNQKIAAMKMKITLEEHERPTPSAQEVVDMLVAKTSPEATYAALKLTGASNLLPLVQKVDRVQAEAITLEALNSANTELEVINQRMGKLENDRLAFARNRCEG